ncbi:hypothetical protein [Bifidobacterium simiarum]|uniref:hypothetical protein n=1 Tax=Bifidobacterium simiarum TaxID=2045441 RepID=UPI001BDC8A7E|nr:hypothetical protein [Bifidobacterium simiarum]MBT1165326.1 hypothetical protein [Bifidobacterium simiarum]
MAYAFIFRITDTAQRGADFSCLRVGMLCLAGTPSSSNVRYRTRGVNPTGVFRGIVIFRITDTARVGRIFLFEGGNVVFGRRFPTSDTARVA